MSSLPVRRQSVSHPPAAWDAQTDELKGGFLDGRLPLILIVVLALALVSALWAAVIYKTDSDRQQVEESIRRDTMNLARAFEEHTVRTLRSVDQALLFVKFQYEQIGDRLDIAEAVQGGMIISNLFNQVGVINAEGIYHLSNIPNFNRVDLKDREHFRVHVDADSKSFFVSKPVLGRATGKWSLQLTRRINRPDGHFGGVAVISVDPFYFTSFYNDVDLGRNGVVTLVGLDGIVRARRAGDTMEVGQDLSRSKLLDLVKQSDAGHYIAKSAVDGVERGVSYRKLKDLPLVVVVGVERVAAMADFEARRLAYLRFASVMTFVIAAFCLLSVGLLTRQRRIAQHLRESQARAESANRLKSEFLASVSHELRTPLNGIMGYAELLKVTATDDEPREYAQTILSSSQHLLELVNSILDLARVEAGEMRLKLGDEKVSALVSEVRSRYLPVAVGKGLTLNATGPADPEWTIRCDHTRVVQILNNLVHNALKFTDTGFVRIEARAEGDRCVFEVSDSGCGIDADMHELIFERFRQADNFETRAHGGAGLGLALCRELAELMGGDISVRSARGQGSTFRLSIPASPVED